MSLQSNITLLYHNIGEYTCEHSGDITLLFYVSLEITIFEQFSHRCYLLDYFTDNLGSEDY